MGSRISTHASIYQQYLHAQELFDSGKINPLHSMFNTEDEAIDYMETVTSGVNCQIEKWDNKYVVKEYIIPPLYHDDYIFKRKTMCGYIHPMG